jgi:hypothetical protein
VCITSIWNIYTSRSTIYIKSILCNAMASSPGGGGGANGMAAPTPQTPTLYVTVSTTLVLGSGIPFFVEVRLSRGACIGH